MIRNERVRQDNTRSKAARTDDVLSVFFDNHFGIRFLALYEVDVASGLNKVQQTKIDGNLEIVQTISEICKTRF